MLEIDLPAEFQSRWGLSKPRVSFPRGSSLSPQAHVWSEQSGTATAIFRGEKQKKVIHTGYQGASQICERKMEVSGKGQNSAESRGEE